MPEIRFQGRDGSNFTLGEAAKLSPRLANRHGWMSRELILGSKNKFRRLRTNSLQKRTNMVLNLALKQPRDSAIRSA
jgi:hypothetical protein